MTLTEAKEIAEDCLVGNGWRHSQGELLAAHHRLLESGDYGRSDVVSMWFNPTTKYVVTGEER